MVEGENGVYHRARCVSFRKTHEAFGGLSNMASGFPLVVNGVRIPSSEALYQACRYPGLPEIQQRIIGENSPWLAKMKGKPFREQSRPDWKLVKVRIMRWCLRVKLAQNWSRFGKLLDDTGDRPIVEDSSRDDFWGAVPQDEETLVGANMLGRLLMELRADLQKPNAECLRSVEPVPIRDFLLYGEPIQAVQAGQVSTGPLTDPDLSPAETALWRLPESVSEVAREEDGPMTGLPSPQPLAGESIAGFATIPERAMPKVPSSAYPKRLIEVDLPIKRISAHARREKSIRHGHISTLHIWWARRPLAACRAVICAALWPDPADPLCPQSFRDAATRIITEFARKACGQGKILTANLSATCSEESLKRWEVLGKPGQGLDSEDAAHLNVLRFALLDFIADFANWDNSTVPEYLETARALTQAAHEALGGEPGTRPLVVDPFAGGGSIPLEALRVGADGFASDLNPVAVLLNKVVLEYIPTYGQRLADEVRKCGRWIKEQAEKELAAFYPKDPDGATPIAYLWARTVTCEGPVCGVEVPLIRTLWLAKKGDRSIALRMVPRPKLKRVDVEILENARAKEVGEGTVKRGSATCPVCGFTTPVVSVRRQLKERRGGASDARLYAVATTRPGRQGRFYRLGNDRDSDAIRLVAEELNRRRRNHKGSLSLVLEESTEAYHSFVNRGPIYGMTKWADYFTPRQALALVTLLRLIREAVTELPSSRCKDYGLAEAVQTCLGLNLDRVLDLANSLCGWTLDTQCVKNLFRRQAIPMRWDFAESVPIGQSAGSWEVVSERFADVLGMIGSDWRAGSTLQASAAKLPLPDDAAQCFVTDPPYYYSVPYADLSDFFYVWLRRVLGDSHVELLRHELTPKDDEIIVQSPGQQFAHAGKNNSFYESRMKSAMAEACRVLAPNGIGVVVFAHTSTAGWEALLQAMIEAGWTITGSWPIDTEMATRVLAQNRSVLASSVHLVCRPRSLEQIGDWRDVLAELPKRIHDWIPRLASEGVVGADAIFACLGPALEIFSRYAKVEKASGERVELREYLEHVWAAVAKEALSTVFAGADATGFDPDARLTAMWFWTLSTDATTNGKSGDEDENEGESDAESPRTTATVSGFVLEYDAARRIAQGLGADLEQLSQIVEVKGDKARLLPVSERARFLFGKDEGKAPSKRGKKKVQQRSLFDEAGDDGAEEGSWGEINAPQAGATVLDRLHQSMILFGAGRSETLKRFLVEDGVGRDARFWRLAQALSALYPGGTEEKRWVDGVLGRKKGLGF